MHHWKLGLAERVDLLKLWILPLVVYPARVVFPTKPAISTLHTVHGVGLRLNAWGMTPSILSLPKAQGGFSVAPPRTFLPWPRAAPSVHSIRFPSTGSKRSPTTIFGPLLFPTASPHTAPNRWDWKKRVHFGQAWEGATNPPITAPERYTFTGQLWSPRIAFMGWEEGGGG
mmetsp:Transcript_87821/g.152827  ORF Transcript_87821/g.152827 Transcript_87821/m.152827 type:complete len:171 (-) Transcript_87821:254-766(-)